MPFKYHPPTRTYCSVCEELAKSSQPPIIDSQNAKASSAENFPVHNWYYFVLGYSPEFPDYLLKREAIGDSHFVLDPFMGSGTTLVCCKEKGIPSAGVDANDYFVDAARTKLNWALDLAKVKRLRDRLLRLISERSHEVCFSPQDSNQLPLFRTDHAVTAEEYAAKHRPKMLTARYISDRPFVKAHIIKELILEHIRDEATQRLFKLALSSIILPISNVKYGPGFGVTKPKEDAGVLRAFQQKIDRMIMDLERITEHNRATPADAMLGDSRELLKYFPPNSVDLMITSPPYPGDHEYTKHTRLELIFMDYAHHIKGFRKIKKRMIRGSTTNMYKGDNDAQYVLNFESIRKITQSIAHRLKHDGATSGFESLYTRLVWEYFGGMYRVLQNVYQILKESGKISLLVSDSHAFKMVHIQTAAILAELAKDIGFRDQAIELWQDKTSTSHRYNMKENILTLTK